uniref:Amidase domain-containing protein n=1 Tax=Panagrellus redivivus TaxID=6233 RepID=A0A7E4ULT7_PANRE
MGVATILRTMFPFTKFISIIYFFFLNLGFNIALLFWKRRVVSRPTNDLILIAATDAAAMIRNGEVQSVHFVQAYIDRMNEVDGVINAVVEDNFDDAIVKAKEVDAYIHAIDKTSDEYKNLAHTKPFLGVPFTTKDSVQVSGFRASAGIASALDNRPKENADVINTMLDAGAIFLALTNVPEATFWSETFNTMFGRTNNPYDSRRSVGGSSGGEGAVLGAAASVIGIGTDIGGSIRIPAIMNGVFGLKCSPGLISHNGIYPVNTSIYRKQMLSVGPMCRYAKDLAPLLRVLVGNDAADNKLKLGQRVPIKKCKFFYMEGLNTPLTEPLSSEVLGGLRKAVKYFETKYDIAVYKVDFPKAHHAAAMFHVSITDRQVASITSLLTSGKGGLNPISELIKCGYGTSKHTFPLMVFCLLDMLPDPPQETKDYIESKREQLRNEVISLLGDNGVLLFPSWPTTAPPHYKNIGTYYNFLYTGLWNTLRLPALAVPMGLDNNGLPLSIQLIGAPHSENMLIATANDLEEGFNGWTAPPGYPTYTLQ